MENLNDKINRFMNRIDEMYQSERYHEKVSKLRCFKGIETFATMTIQVETMILNVFQAQKHMHPILDLQQENILVAIKNNRIGITKQGNTVIRKTLVECAQSFGERKRICEKITRVKKSSKRNGCKYYCICG